MAKKTTSKATGLFLAKKFRPFLAKKSNHDTQQRSHECNGECTCEKLQSQDQFKSKRDEIFLFSFLAKKVFFGKKDQFKGKRDEIVYDRAVSEHTQRNGIRGERDLVAGKGDEIKGQGDGIGDEINCQGDGRLQKHRVVIKEKES